MDVRMGPWIHNLYCIFMTSVLLPYPFDGTNGFVSAYGNATNNGANITVRRPPEYFDQQCAARFGGVNFFAWVVRITMKDWYNSRNSDRIIATGNIVTEDWILTACTPFHQVIQMERWDTIRVLPAVTEYTEVLPVREKGIFPYASHADTGCIVGRYLVVEKYYTTVDDQQCTDNTAAFPNTMVSNMLLLQMESRITVGSYKLFPRMPFSYNFNSLVRKIDWFNTYRKSRCVVARVVNEIGGIDTDDYPIYSNKFEQEGFTYKTMPYRVECIPAVCKKTCSAIEERRDCKEAELTKEGSCSDLKMCRDDCVRKMEPLLGTLICLIRMHEREKGNTLVYTLTYDNYTRHTPYETPNVCVPGGTSHPIINSPHYMGAPVVCDGEVIAIITKCDEDFLVATSIVPIRHRLLKLFDTSYQASLTYLTDH